MARQTSTISRKLTFTEVEGFKCVEGEPSPFKVNISGDLTVDKAQQILRRKNASVMVTKTTPITNVYQMSIDDFINHATVKE